MEGKYFDFDQAFKAKKRVPVIVTMFGKKWKLPPAVPAEIMLHCMRLKAEKSDDEELSNAQMELLLSQIVPAAILEKWFNLGLGSDQYAFVILKLLDIYNGIEPGEKDAPEAGA